MANNMSDVTLTVLAMQLPVVLELCNVEGYTPNEVTGDANDGVVLLRFPDVEWGMLEIEEKLMEKGIPFDRQCEAGDDYGATLRQVRVGSDGQVHECCEESGGESNDEIPASCVLIEDVIRAYDEGEFEIYIEYLKSNPFRLTWAEQQQIVANLQVAAA